MLNACLLNHNFVKALEQSWDIAAMLPEYQERYVEDMHHPSYGQCLVASLAAWSYHQDLNADIVFGMVYDEGAYTTGGWHAVIMAEENIPIDVTREQFVGEVRFELAQGEEKRRIAEGSMIYDTSLEMRLNVTLNNLRRQGIEMQQTAGQIIHQACLHLGLL